MLILLILFKEKQPFISAFLILLLSQLYKTEHKLFMYYKKNNNNNHPNSHLFLFSVPCISVCTREFSFMSKNSMADNLE